MKSHQRTEGLNDEWLTPSHIIQALGPFDLDPCAPANPPWRTAETQYSEHGLEKPWFGYVWCNPPFNRYERPKWMAKMAYHGNGIMLIPAATETEAFDQHVWKRATSVCFLKGRPHFHFIDGARSKANCGTAIALCGYGHRATQKLIQANLGKTIVL